MYQEFLLNKSSKRVFSLVILLLFANTIFADHISRGKKIVDIFCQKQKLENLNIKTIKDNEILKYCHNIDIEDIKDIRVYLQDKSKNNQNLPSIFPIPKDTRCPVCGMAINLYPKWSAMITTKDRKIYFDGIKDMMKYYLDRASFHFDRDKIIYMVVKEFYHLKDIDAKIAWYVIGSDVRGPMGAELIPFKSKDEAKIFMQDHHGKKIIRFNDITLHLIKSLRLYR